MNGRMAVIAAIVSWFARGASPIDGMYWFDAKSVSGEKLRQQRVPAPADTLGSFAHCG